MITGVQTDSAIDSDLLATDVFDDPAYQDAALNIANRIRSRLGLPEADRLLAGYRGDTRWGNPVVFTIAAGEPLMVAHLEANEGRIVVDSIDSETSFRLINGSVVTGFIERFEAGSYPELEALRKES